jgi:DNA-binding CsgD family transcriptional regulator
LRQPYVIVGGMQISAEPRRTSGAQLYLSHRTVASHLYRLFPKLGISSRAQLARAMRSRREG